MRSFQRIKSSPRRRISFVEKLEDRSLFAVECFHNIELPEDADGSGSVTPLDALVVINQLNQSGVDLGSVLNVATSTMMADIDGDAVVSPLDALQVINRLNNVSSMNAVSTAIENQDIEERIARIERILETRRLAPHFTVDDAIEIISSLWAQRETNHGTSGQPDSDSNDEHSMALVSDDSETGSQSHHGRFDAVPRTEAQLNRQIEKLSTKLTSTEVATAVIETISTEMRDAFAAGTPLTIIAIKSRLTELGVDVDAVFSRRPERPETPNLQERLIQNLTRELTKIETDPGTIATIVAEIKAASEAGTPMTLLQIRTRLIELGVDVTELSLGPRRHHRHR